MIFAIAEVHNSGQVTCQQSTRYHQEWPKPRHKAKLNAKLTFIARELELSFLIHKAMFCQTWFLFAQLKTMQVSYFPNQVPLFGNWDEVDHTNVLHLITLNNSNSSCAIRVKYKFCQAITPLKNVQLRIEIRLYGILKTF